MKWDLVKEGRGWKGLGEGLSHRPGWRMPWMLASSERLVQRLCPWNSFSPGALLCGLCQRHLYLQLFFLGLSERVIQHSALASLTTWYSGLGLCDYSGPPILDTLSPDTFTSRQPLVGYCLSFFLGSLLFPWIWFIVLPGPHKLKKGEVAMGRVVKVTPKEGLTVSFPFGRVGRVSMFHVSDSYSETHLEDFVPQQVVR